MIRQMNSSDAAKLRELCEDDVFLTRIIAARDVYENTNVVQTWVQLDGPYLCTVLNMVDGVMTAAYFRDGNVDELMGFFYALQPQSLISSELFAKKIGANIVQSGDVLVYENIIKPEIDFTYTLNPQLRSIYEIMLPCKSMTFNVPDWEPFYMDMSHRIRHDGAISVAISDEKRRMVACGFTTSQTMDTAIISGVCVTPSVRHQGYGSKIVKALLKEIPQEQVFVLRGENEVVGFYEQLSFTKFGRWAESTVGE